MLAIGPTEEIQYFTKVFKGYLTQLRALGGFKVSSY